VSDIFISYASEDRERVEPLAHALEAEGWLIFWDQTIPPGESWVKYIGKALDDARCVVVIWSEASVESSWVYEEAERGRQRGVLIPVLFDNVSIPLGFASLQAAKLITWDGTPTSPGFQQLRLAIERRLGPSPVARQQKGEVEQEQPTKEKVHRKAEELGRRRALKPTGTRPIVEPSRPRPKVEIPEGVYLDPQTKLMWTIEDNGKDINWHEANEYAKRLRLGGYSDWRLPTIEELEKLYDPKAVGNTTLENPLS
jgi:TIR domain/Protein of unknown function (DUF1566)